MNVQQFVSEREAAKIFGLSPRTLLGWRLRGLGPPARRFGRTVRYALTDLDEFAARSRVNEGAVG